MKRKYKNMTAEEIYDELRGPKNKTQTTLLITAFKAPVRVETPMLSLTNRRGAARIKLMKDGLLKQTSSWVTETGTFVSINEITQVGHDHVLQMMRRDLYEHFAYGFVAEEIEDFDKKYLTK